MVHGQGHGALGLLVGNTASGVSEARGLSEEVLSVLKALGFVFTENPLQALVLRTVGMTHLWDICGDPVSARCRASGPHEAGSTPYAFETPGASVV